MTREDAIDLIEDNCPMNEIVKEYIDEIYDDFESRTCENCKYNSYGYCNNDRSCCERIEDWFGCNKWESK